jgi:CheY-like chemotaxis protein
MSSTPQTILNVDDAEVARYAKHRTLTHAGFNVVDSASGADALAQVAAVRPALVLLDVRLPDMSGIDVCKTIKQRWPTIVVLQTSASAA